MTQDEIIRMAREAGYQPNSSTTVMPMKDYANYGISYELERFAALVAAHEREACAKVCDALANTHEKMNQWGSYKTADCLSQAIRARSN